jgi:hypothetical protein
MASGMLVILYALIVRFSNIGFAIVAVLIRSGVVGIWVYGL